MSSRSASGCRVLGDLAAAGCCARGRRRAGRGPARRPVHSRDQLELVRALQHHDVDVGVGAARSGGTSTDRRPASPRCARGRARPGRGRAATGRGSRAAPGRTRRPRAVHVPEQDPHAGHLHGVAQRPAADGVRVGDATLGQARVAGDRAVAGPGAGAGRVLVAEQHVRHAVGRQRAAGTTGANRRDDRGADGGGEVRRPGVADDDGSARGQHARPARRGRCGRRGRRAAAPATARGQRALAGAAGDHDPVAVGDQRRDQLARSARPARRGRAPRRRGARRRSGRRPASAGVGGGGRTAQPAVVAGGQREAGGARPATARARPRAGRRRRGAGRRAASRGSRR